MWHKSTPPSTQVVGYNGGVHRWRVDASLTKNVPIHEQVVLRFSADFLNVFNAPNNPNSIGGDGIHSTRSSGIGPRILRLSLHLS